MPESPAMHPPFVTSALLIASASIAPAATASRDAPSPILTSPDAKDVLSYARPEIARVTHIDLDLTADFKAHVMHGTATLDILARPGAREIVLDDKDLVIARITDASGRPLK